jgi:hypothetical protein
MPFTLMVAAQLLAVDQTDPIGFRVDNGVFVADHSRRNGVDSGTLHKLTFKAAGVSFERTPTNWMHWAPSFQRVGARAYTSISTWDPVQTFRHDKSDRRLVFTREGRHQLYPEIRLWTEYAYESGAPYFVFHAILTVEKPIDMFWLRGQEMTMDSHFTHAAWPGPDGKPVVADFEARKPILDQRPIPVDAPWIAFLNQEKGYGYGAVTLDFKATKLAKATLSINDGAGNGKYWDRRIINQEATRLEPGDRFEERTAYVVFRRLDEFLGWAAKLRK